MWDNDTVNAVLVVMALYLFGRWLAGEGREKPRLRPIKGRKK